MLDAQLGVGLVRRVRQLLQGNFEQDGGLLRLTLNNLNALL